MSEYEELGSVMNRFRRRRKLLLSVLAIVVTASWSGAAKNMPLTAADRKAQPDSGQSQPALETKVLRDARDSISFSYPGTYVVDNAAASRWQKGAEARHATAHIVAWLSNKHNGANIIVMIVPVPFDLGYIRKGAPTGMEDWFWLRFTAFGDNKFYFYSGGNQSVQHPDEYFYDLNNTILSFVFDGPYSTKSLVMPDWAEVGPIETLVLSSLKAPVNRPSPALPGSFHYTNERYGFQLTLNAAWKGYEVSQQQMGTNGITYLVFSVPSSRFAGNRMSLLWLGVQSPQTWQRRRSHCDCVVNTAPSMFGGTGATVIGRTRTQVFSLEFEYRPTGKRKYQFDRVIESFALLH